MGETINEIGVKRGKSIREIELAKDKREWKKRMWSERVHWER